MRSLRLFLATGLSLCYLHAGTIFVGVGNNEFAGDIPTAANAIRPYASTVTTLNNQDQGILTAINNASTNNLGGFGSTDAFIFYYAGHGGKQLDGAGPEMDHIIGTSTDGGATFPNNPVTDDQLTAAIQALNGAHPGVGVLIVLDTCFAGTAVADNTDLKATDSAVIGTADANNCAPGVSKFLPLWVQAFQMNGGYLRGDADHNSRMTLQELFDFTKSIPNGGENPFALQFGSNDMSVIVASTPEPATFLLCFGTLAAVAWRRRRT